MKTFILLFAFFLASIHAHCQFSADSTVVWELNMPSRDVDVSPDGTYFVVVDDYGYLKLFNTIDGSLIKKIKAHETVIQSARFSYDGKYLAICCAIIPQIIVWRTSDWSIYKIFKDDIASNTMYASFSHNGKQIAACVGLNKFRIWDLESGDLLKTILTESTDMNKNPLPLSIEYSKNDSLLALSATYSTGRVYDYSKDTTILYTSSESRFSTFSRDGELFIAEYENSDNDKGICIYDIKERKLFAYFKIDNGIVDADQSFDYKYLAFGRNQLLIYDIEKNIFAYSLPYSLNSVRFIPNTNYILIADGITTRKLDFNKIVSVNDHENLSNTNIIQISPNPSSDFINISYFNNRVHPTAIRNNEIKIYNSIGEFIFSVALQNPESQQIDISGLPPGLYFVRYGSEYGKFIKE
jgi:WD40 repeat protein